MISQFSIDNSKVKILLISQSISAGGAAIATKRIFECLKSGNFNVKWIVADKASNSDKNVVEMSYMRKKFSLFFSKIDWRICRLIQPNNLELQTAAFFGALSARYINKSKVDIVNLHWVGHGLLSLRQINKIKKPIIWTMHDEWLLHEISHYEQNIHPSVSRNLLVDKCFASLKTNRLKLKQKILCKDQVYIVCPSEQLAEKFRARFPQKCNKIFFIHNPVCMDEFFPVISPNFSIADKRALNSPIALYLGGTSNFRKGWDLLEGALDLIDSPLVLLMSGNCDRKKLGKFSQIEIVNFKKVYDLETLRNLYSLANFVIVPSRNEAGGPQIATEALSCGTPVVGFQIGSMPEIIEQDITGQLAKNQNIANLSACILRMLGKSKEKYTYNCRQNAQEKFSFSKILRQYEVLLHTKIENVS